ncbi:MAG: PQQ-binding-like beta-propeller repeat protein [Bryobacteraceae bacterium]
MNLQRRRIAWTYEHPEKKFPFYATAAVAQGKVVAGGRDKMIHTLDARTGKALWTFPTKARVESSPVLADGRIFFGSNDGHFYALDFASGKELWNFNATAPVSATPAFAGDRIVVGDQDGRVYCFGA